MDEKTFISALTYATKCAKEDLRLAVNDGSSSWAHFSPATVNIVKNELDKSPSSSKFIGKWYVLPNEGGLISSNTWATFLINRAMENSIDKVAYDFFELLNSKKTTITKIWAVEGVELETEIQLGNGFSLSPVTRLPNVDNTKIVFSNTNVPRHGWGTSPKCAITRTFDYDFKLYDPPTGSNSLMSYNDNFQEELNTLKQIIDTIIICSNGVPQIRQGYSVVNNLGWVSMQSNGIGISEGFPRPVIKCLKIDRNKLGFLFEKLRVFGGKSSNRIEVAIKKIINARQESDVLEKYIDYGSCLELILTANDNNIGEISYKIANRAAWLIGDEISRLETFNTSKNLYNLRSKAIHTGIVKQPKNMDETNEQYANIEKFDELCCNAICRILEVGSFPNWEKLTLGL